MPWFNDLLWKEKAPPPKNILISFSWKIELKQLVDPIFLYQVVIYLLCIFSSIFFFFSLQQLIKAYFLLRMRPRLLGQDNWVACNLSCIKARTFHRETLPNSLTLLVSKFSTRSGFLVVQTLTFFPHPTPISVRLWSSLWNKEDPNKDVKYAFQ